MMEIAKRGILIVGALLGLAVAMAGVCWLSVSGEARADALDLVRAGLAAGEHRRLGRLHGDDVELPEMPPQRRRHTADALGGPDGLDEGVDPALGLAMDLEAALGVLNAQDRAVVWLHDVEGYNHKEIAELFGKTESFSKTRLSRARGRLRDLLQPRQSTATGLR